MKKTWSVLVLVLFLSNVVHASTGSETGNGGDAIACYTDASRSKITSVRMFDYWEQEQVLNYGHVDLGSSQLSIQDKIEIATKRISKFDPLLGGEIKKMALNLANNIQSYLVTNYVLPEIDDAHPRAVPTEPNCYIEQYAVQYKDLTTGQRRFSIADKFYSHANTSNDDRAGIILHEAIYRYAIRIDPSLSSSDDVRYFNYVAGASLLDTLKVQDIQQFHDILVKTKINQPGCELKDGVYLRSALNYNEQNLSCYNQKMNLSSNISVVLTGGTTIDYHVMIPDNYRPRSYYPRKGITLVQRDANLPLVVEINYEGQIKKFSAGQVEMSENNLALNSMNPNDPTSSAQTIKGPGGTDFVCQSSMNFHVNSLELISCRIKKTQVVANLQTYELGGYMQQLSRDRWIIDPINHTNGPDNKFSLLGSKKPLSISSYRGNPSDMNTTCKNNLITVDSAYNVVAGCFNYEYPMEVNGQTVGLLNDFEVQWIKGNYFLKGQVTYNHNAKGIYNPTFKNLRLLKTSHDEKFNYCGTLAFPSKETWVWGASAEYVGYPGESFYDISTDSIVYKTDENISVVNRVGCKASYFLSDNY